jgi:hypothetical protein
MHLTELPVARPHEKELVKPSDANIVDNHIAGLATADFSAPTRTAGRWDPSDLIRRVLNALDMAIRTIGSLGDVNSANVTAASPSKNLFIDEKIVAETAMLLLCVQPISRLDQCIRKRFDAIAALLVPLARKTEVLAAICLEPGLAREHAVAHIILSRLGYPDRDVDRLLSESLGMGAEFGPERLPHRRLEQEWLARLWSVGDPPRRRDSRLLADSMLGRPTDALGPTRFDIYAFSHAVMYASDLGGRRITLPRPSTAIAASADAALAYSLDSNDCDLVAEVSLTWPMLHLTWSPAATFAFSILAGIEDNLGFLPGLPFDLAHYQTLTGDDRSRYSIVTSYHTSYIMGFLCATALGYGCAPPAAVPRARRSRGAGAAIMHFLKTDGPRSCWMEPFSLLAPRQQDSLAPWLLAILLRRARTAGNLSLIRDALEVAVAYELIDGPAPLQAAALLRRSQTINL